MTVSQDLGSSLKPDKEKRERLKLLKSVAFLSLQTMYRSLPVCLNASSEAYGRLTALHYFPQTSDRSDLYRKTFNVYSSGTILRETI